MLTSFITLPFRLGLRGTELGIRVGLAVAERAIELAGEVLAPTASQTTDRDSPPSSARGPEPESDRSTGSPAAGQPKPSESGGDPRSAAPSPEQAVKEQQAAAAERPTPAPSVPAPPEPPPPPPPPPPAPAQPRRPSLPASGAAEHVDEGAELVAEVAEPGAEDGAGAEIHISEPWDGYAKLKAADVVDQLAGRDRAELATIELYESLHRQRQMVIDAAKRELRRLENTP